MTAQGLTRRRLVGLGALAAGAAATGAFALARGVGRPAPVPPGPAVVRGPVPFPPGAIDILALGTSLTARGGWAEPLETALQATRPGSRVSVLARPGANSGWGQAALGRRVAPRAPQVVLVEFAVNDASLVRGMSLGRSAATHRRILNQVRSAGAIPVLMTMAPADGREALERPGLSAFHAQDRTLAARWPSALVDAAPGWGVLDPAEREALMPDGLHPTAEAWSRMLLPLLLRLLA